MSLLTKEITLPKLRAPQLRVPNLPRRQVGGARAAGARGTAVTGLEISATQLIAAEALMSEGVILARRVAARPLPAGLVHDGLVVEAEALARELRALFAEHRLGRRVRVGLATPRTILRVIDLPPLDEADVRLVLPMQARDRIPMPLESAVLDHQTIGLVDTPEGQRLRVVVVATEQKGVDALLSTLREAGLRPEGIDLSVFAAMRAVATAQPSEGPMLHAQLGDLVNIAVADHGICQFTRQAPQGLALVLERLIEQRGCTPESALALLRAAAGDAAEVAGAEEAREVGVVLHRVADELGSELRTAAEFFSTQSGQTVSAGVITGQLASLRGFVEALSDASGLELRCGTVQTADEEALGGVDPRAAAVAVGLAIGELAR
ncbi:MAG TPA: pilus assembly protein PilM [Solirubrobacteraceae bacterium]|nr:pilus assembly protein PilM [Solirubrobacteraceae bacterium]